jgi:starch-binding outer membrane protein, SusD/RagB family
MRTRYFKIMSVMVLMITLAITSCVKDLDTIPKDPDIVTSATVYKDAEAYRQVLAKCYAGLAVSGQQGPAGMPDISGIDEGFSQYLRQLWLAQELTTDEAVIAWNDGTLRNYHEQNWTPAGEFITALYNRIFYQISLCNEFIREASDDRLSGRGITGADLGAVQQYRAEARFLRAFSYFHALDMFGNVPFVDETTGVGAFLPEQISRPDLFSYVESELLAIEPEMLAPKTEYGRADQAAVWMLLSRLYLNAAVYSGTPRYNDAVAYSKRVIDLAPTTYTLEPQYEYLFLADNNLSNEIIFPITFDGVHTRTYGGTTFIIHAAVGGNMSPAAFGVDGPWAGTRVTSALVDKFEDPTGATDSRAMFHTDGQTLEITNIFAFTEGYAVTKWKNVTRNGQPGSNATFTDTDFPVFRLAEAYLNYAEAVIRGGTGGTPAEALGYVNLLRQRAYNGNTGNLASAAALTLDFIIDERAREFYWEAHRRTDLIRFGRFSQSTYLWPWKGNVPQGISTSSHLDLFPVPSADIGANPNLEQNQGY